MNDSLNIPRSLLAAVIATTFAAAPAMANPNDPQLHADETVHAADQVDALDTDRDYVASGDDMAVDPDELDSNQPLDDTWITTKVKTALMADEDVDALEIDVDTVDGVVHLSGEVDDHGEAREAVATVRDIDGVRDVNTARLAITSR